jgi:GntR family transcriptional repressor for pyruvate dehydrogenase complex
VSDLSSLTGGVDRTRFSDQVALKLRRLIEQGQLRPGEQLPAERQLCEMLGVSRTVVREATCALEQYGLINIVQGRGTFVAQPDLHTLTDSLVLWARVGRQPEQTLLETRFALEIEIAGLASQRAKALHLEKMQVSLQAMDAEPHNSQDYILADHAFHLALAEASRNELLLALVQSLVGPLQESRARIYQTPGAPDRGQKCHRQIFTAILRGDPEGARQGMRRHLEQIQEDSGISL